MTYFSYQQEAIDYLCEQDPRLGLVIERVGPVQRHVIPDLFPGLVRILIEQQISMKAAETVWRRLCDLAGEITPANIASLDDEVIQKQGMTMRKARAIRAIASMVVEGDLDLDRLKALDDESVEKTLVLLPGIGVWSAEMLMLFSLQRQNILSWHDLGIRKGLMLLHRLNKLDKKNFMHYCSLYSPYGSLASLYIWEVAANPGLLSE